MSTYIAMTSLTFLENDGRKRQRRKTGACLGYLLDYDMPSASSTPSPTPAGLPKSSPTPGCGGSSAQLGSSTIRLRLAVVEGTRPEYALSEFVFRLREGNGQNHTVGAAGSHLSQRYRQTVDLWEIDSVVERATFCFQRGNDPIGISG